MDSSKRAYSVPGGADGYNPGDFLGTTGDEAASVTT
jgi:hypothetical protein